MDSHQNIFNLLNCAKHTGINTSNKGIFKNIFADRYVQQKLLSGALPIGNVLLTGICHRWQNKSSFTDQEKFQRPSGILPCTYQRSAVYGNFRILANSGASERCTYSTATSI